MNTNSIKHYLSITFVIYIIFSLSVILSGVLIYHSPDYQNYFTFYTETIKNNSANEVRFEPGYYYLVYIFNQLNVSFEVFVGITATIMILVKSFVAYKINKKNIIFFLILYLLISFITFDIIQLRVAFGMAFVILSIYTLKKSIYFSLLLILIGCCFHYSLFLFFPIIIMAKFLFNREKKVIFIFLYAFYVVIFFSINIISFFKLNPLIDSYLNDKVNYANIFAPYNLFIFIMFVLYFSLYNHFSKIGKCFYISATLIYLFALNFSFAPVIYFRYIDISLVLLLFCSISINNKKFNNYSILLMILFGLYKFLTSVYLHPILNLQ